MKTLSAELVKYATNPPTPAENNVINQETVTDPNKLVI